MRDELDLERRTSAEVGRGEVALRIEIEHDAIERLPYKGVGQHHALHLAHRECLQRSSVYRKSFPGRPCSKYDESKEQSRTAQLAARRYDYE